MKWITLTFLAVLFLCATTMTVSLQAQAPIDHNLAQSKRTKVDPDALREMLVKGLKVTRDNEKQYIDQVVVRVTKGTLGVSLVYASFKYARTRRPQYPYPYFVYSVETLAKRGSKR